MIASHGLTATANGSPSNASIDFRFLGQIIFDFLECDQKHKPESIVLTVVGSCLIWPVMVDLQVRPLRNHAMFAVPVLLIALSSQIFAL